MYFLIWIQKILPGILSRIVGNVTCFHVTTPEEIIDNIIEFEDGFSSKLCMYMAVQGHTMPRTLETNIAIFSRNIWLFILDIRRKKAWGFPEYA